MLLSKPQKAILDYVRSLGAIRRDQLLPLLADYGTPDLTQLGSMLRQLCFGDLLALSGDIVLGRGARMPEEVHFEAIDVMLELTHGQILACSRDRGPVLLRFLSGGERPRSFFVVSAQKAELGLPLSLLPGQRAIVLLAENDPALCRALPSSHYTATAGPDGTHRFYRCGGK